MLVSCQEILTGLYFSVFNSSTVFNFACRECLFPPEPSYVWTQTSICRIKKITTSVSRNFKISFINCFWFRLLFAFTMVLKPVFESIRMSACPLYLQHTSEWPDCGGGWYQPGGCHSAVCCYSAEEHQGHSGVSLKFLLHFTEPLKA